MAQQNKRSSQKSGRNSSSSRGRQSGGKTAAKRGGKYSVEKNDNQQVVSVLLFAIAILILCLDFIKGQSVWEALRGFIFGIFGLCAYIVPLIIGYIAVIYAKGEERQSIGVKLIQAAVFAALLGALLHLFSDDLGANGVGEFIKLAYVRGSQIKSGGVFGGMIGETLWVLCGRLCAKIIVIILAFIFYMLVTGTSILSLFVPFKKLRERRKERMEERALDAVQDDDIEEEHPVKVKGGNFNAIPITDSSINFNYEGDEPQVDNCNFPLVTDVPYHSVESELEDNKKSDTPKKAERSSDKKAEKAQTEKTPKKAESRSKESEFAPPVLEMADSSGYRFPPYKLLDYPKNTSKSDPSQLHETARTLVETLRSFNVETEITNISRGPAITRFELRPAPGVKISKITNLADDIALSLAASGVRIEAPIPGKAAVGIEVPNKDTGLVSLREIIESEEFAQAKSKLTIALGRDIAGNIAITDIAKMPHALIAGATGSGKSVCINSIILSIIYKASPEDVKLLMIDPKVVELGMYNGIPHLIVPVVTDARKAAGALGWAVTEMLNRYQIFAQNGVKDLAGYNELAQTRDDLCKKEQIVIIIDELADLMMVAPNEVEDSIMRLAQMARAAGMHLIIATQRPSVDVITGTIKTNIPSRIAFAVSSGVDSRIILDSYGAEKLIGKGDMLFSPVGVSKPSRIQGCFVSAKEIEAVIDFLKNNQQVEYSEDVQEEIERQATLEKSPKGRAQANNGDESADEKLAQAIETVVMTGQASTSFLQRKLGLGYARAARLVDEMEARGIVGPSNGAKPRDILITKEQFMEMQNAGSDLLD